MMDEVTFIKARNLRSDLMIANKRRDELRHALDNIEECSSPCILVNEDKVTLPLPAAALPAVLEICLGYIEDEAADLQEQWNHLRPPLCTEAGEG